MPAEAVVLVICSASVLTLMSGVAWLVNCRQQRGRRRQGRRQRGRRTWSLAALRDKVTNRQAAWWLGGLLLVILAGWWAADWRNGQATPDENSREFVQGIAGEGGTGEVVAFDAAIDPATRQKLLAERWQRGLPLLALIGLVVAAWVGLAHSGWLEQHHRRKIAVGRTQDRV